MFQLQMNKRRYIWWVSAKGEWCLICTHPWNRILWFLNKYTTFNCCSLSEMINEVSCKYLTERCFYQVFNGVPQHTQAKHITSLLHLGPRLPIPMKYTIRYVVIQHSSCLWKKSINTINLVFIPLPLFVFLWLLIHKQPQLTLQYVLTSFSS